METLIQEFGIQLCTRSGRLGTASKYWITSVDNGTSNTTTVSKITTLGSNSVPIAVDYNAGVQPKDSKR